MKNLTLLFILALITISCSDDIESNTPSIQGELNGTFFRSNSSTAFLNADQSITLTGETGLDRIILKTSDFEIGEYILGQGTQSEAAYEVGGSNIYSTGTTGDGLIEITRIGENTVSGEFYFNAISGDTINVSKGSFFDVPIANINGGSEGGSCGEVTLEASDAATAYNNADPSDDDYEQICIAYAAALQAIVDSCVDAQGALETLNSLDCSGTEEVESTFTAQVNSQEYEYAELTANQTGSITLTALEENVRRLAIAIPNNLEVGTYGYNQITSNGLFWVYEPSWEEPTVIESQSVILNITEHDMANFRIVGNFEFNSTDSQDATIEYLVEGEFDIYY